MFRYDQTLFEDDNKNRMMETKELFEWVLKQPCFEVSFPVEFSCIYPCLQHLVFREFSFQHDNFSLAFTYVGNCRLTNIHLFSFLIQKTSFMLFLNKFDIFEKKILKVSSSRSLVKGKPVVSFVL